MAGSFRQLLRNLKKKEEILLEKYKEEKANRTFKCDCGRYHRIKDCDVIQTHWYVEPYSCSGGGYWVEGELQIICPYDDHKERVMISNNSIPYELRHKYNFNPEEQFKREYKKLFKSIIDDYKKDQREWKNNYYFQDNLKKFDLYIGEENGSN